MSNCIFQFNILAFTTSRSVVCPPPRGYLKYFVNLQAGSTICGFLWSRWTSIPPKKRWNTTFTFGVHVHPRLPNLLARPVSLHGVIWKTCQMFGEGQQLKARPSMLFFFLGEANTLALVYTSCCSYIYGGSVSDSFFPLHTHCPPTHRILASFMEGNAVVAEKDEVYVHHCSLLLCRRPSPLVCDFDTCGVAARSADRVCTPFLNADHKPAICALL